MKISLPFLLVFPFVLNGQIKEIVYPIENQEIYLANSSNLLDAKFTVVEFEKTECLSDQARFEMDIEIAENKALILQENPDAFSHLGNPVLFIEPIRPKDGFSEYGYHTINFNVDHNLTPNNQLLDYNCGNRTYDWASGNHQGTDLILWPYPWKRMAENVMEVVAAAEGVIVNKKDGFNDLSCVNNGNPNWNGFVLEHADGSQTIYMHFKKNTLNPKGIGDTVSAGEFLGVAGSSGSSNWPHLHFEVRDFENQVIDPYQGPCNSMNDTSWWQVQEPYAVPRINEISTHYVGTQDTECPVIENTYKKINFVPGDMLYLKIFYRDINDGDITNIQFKKPNGEILYNWNWTNNWGAFYATAHATWEFQTDNTWMDGVYTVTATFGGNTYETIFGINTNMGLDESDISSLEIYPNPARNMLNVKFDKVIQSVGIIGLDGRVYSHQETNAREVQLNVNSLPKGVYLIRIKSGNTVEHKKFIKE